MRLVTKMPGRRPGWGRVAAPSLVPVGFSHTAALPEVLEGRRLLAGWTISGRVLDTEPGHAGPIINPLSGATVYADLNGNGAADPGEPSATTGADGAYVLTGSGAGTVSVREVPPPDGSHFAAGETGIRTVAVANGQSLSLTDFQDTEAATLSGTVFEDLNGNGIQDPGEPGLSGWTLSLSQLDPDLPHATTDGSGNWAATVPGGTYQVRLFGDAETDTLSNWFLTAPVGGVYQVTVAGNDIGALSFGVRPAPAAGTPAADLVVTPGGLRAKVPSATVGGQAASASIRITNTGDALAAPPTSIRLYASSVVTVAGEQFVHLKAGDTLLADAQEKAPIPPGKSRTVVVRFTLPTTLLAGEYGLVAVVGPQQAAPGASDVAGAGSVRSLSGSVFTFLPPAPDLAIAVVSVPLRLVSNQRGAAIVRITNVGGANASGNASIELFASTDQTVDASDTPLIGTTLPIHMRRGRARRLRLTFSASSAGLSAGNYFLIATLSPSLSPPDANATNNTGVSDAAVLLM